VELNLFAFSKPWMVRLQRMLNVS